jgi:Protein of unknown function (DUF642)
MLTASLSILAASMPRQVHRAALGIGSVLMTLSALVPSVHAQSVLNGGFETPPVPTGGFTHFVGGQTVGAWTVVGTAVLLVQTQYAEPAEGISSFAAQAGLNSLDLTGAGNEGFTSGVEQAVQTTAGQAYHLSFFVGRASSASPLYSAPATVDLSINGGPRVGYTNAAATPGTTNWMKFTTSFVATGSSTTLAFYNGTPVPTTEAGLDSVVLTPAFSEVGAGLAGVHGVPHLAGAGTLAAGSAGSLSLTLARPSSTAVLFMSLSSTPTPFKGGTLIPIPPLLTLSMFTNGSGGIVLPFVWPSGMPAGTSIYFQYAIQDAAAVKGVALSNGLKGITP